MQDAEYLAAHKRLVELEAENAALKAQVEELQTDVSRLTIENGQLEEKLTTNPYFTKEEFESLSRSMLGAVAPLPIIDPVKDDAFDALHYLSPEEPTPKPQTPTE